MRRRRAKAPEPSLPEAQELAAAWDGLPLDPRTGYPPGLLGFLLELERRKAWGRRQQTLRKETRRQRKERKKKRRAERLEAELARLRRNSAWA